MSTFVRVGMLIMLCVTLEQRGFCLSRDQVEHDVGMDSIARRLFGEDPFAMYAYYGTNNLNFIFTGDKSGMAPYQYYLKDPAVHGMRVSAVNTAGGKDYIYDIKWGVTYYEALGETNAPLGLKIMKWASGDLAEDERELLLEAIGWRGLFTKSIYKDHALHDILGTIAIFYNDDEVRSTVRDFVIDPENDEQLKRVILSSLMGMFDDFNASIQKEVLFLAKCYLAEVRDEEKEAYFNIRTLFEAGVRAGVSPMK